MKNMKVSAKLILSFLIVIALAIIVGAVGIIGMMQINDGSNEMYEMQTAPLADIAYAREYFQRLRVQLREVQMSTTLDELAAVEREISIREDQFEHYMALYDPTIVTPHGRQMLSEMMNAYNAYTGHVREINADIRGRIEQQNIMDAAMPPAAALANSIAEGLVELKELRVDRTLNATEYDDVDTLINSLVDVTSAVEFMQRMRVQLREAQLSATLEELAAVEAEIANRSAMFLGHMRRYSATIETSAAQTLFSDTMASFNQYTDHVADIVAAQRQIITHNNRVDAIMQQAGPEADMVANTLADLMDARVDLARDNYESNATMFSMMLIVILVVLAVAIAAALFLALYISRLFSKPLTDISAFLEKAATTGDLSLSEKDAKNIAVIGAYKDEIGRTMKGTAAFVTQMTNMAEELAVIASGDLTREVTPLSDKDTMGNAMQNLLGNLNSMFGEINTATAQVASGSKQIADGSQTLAQGSTEQAASVQQLSSSISEIAQKTKGNADMAGKAAALANNIKGSAEKGNRQMGEMMNAVKDINESSQNISKVIKSIDDIAFQTNILALNAAVEAARAGQHGKGFAVVAEEVRNLAAKSAAAAKDTESLIADSIEKSGLGSKIADETAASLVEIVSGIEESSRLVSDIATSSEEQSAGITQINTGVDQVAQVVQQNSATAEESAAAAQEMSGQSDMLEQLISQFKLKSSGGVERISAPTAPAAQAAESLPAPEKAEFDDGFGKY